MDEFNLREVIADADHEYWKDWAETSQVPVHQKAIIGHRIWRINRKGELTAMTNSYAWKPGANISESAFQSDKSGFHSFFSFGAEEMNKICKGKPRYVLGAVAGAGDVQLYPAGFRSEKAQIIALYSPSFLSKRKSKKLASLGKHYEVPVFSGSKAFLDFTSKQGKVHSAFPWEVENALFSAVLFNLREKPRSLANRWYSISIGSVNIMELTLYAIIAGVLLFFLSMFLWAT